MNLFFPLVGAPYGIPLKTFTPSRTTPRTLPDAVSAMGPDSCARADARERPATPHIIRPKSRRFMDAPPSFCSRVYQVPGRTPASRSRANGSCAANAVRVENAIDPVVGDVDDHVTGRYVRWQLNIDLPESNEIGRETRELDV